MKAGPKWNDMGIIFTTRTGRHIRPNNISGYLRKDLEAASLPRVRFYDLRHSLATIMAADGAHVAVIAGMLGHANPTTTLSTYTHFVPGMQSMAVSRLNEMFPPPWCTTSRSCPRSPEKSRKILASSKAT
jgi:integrase